MPRKLKEFYLTIDLRSLGLYRILLGSLLIVDWFTRWPDLEAFYTSFGVVPIEAPLPKPGGNFHFCLLDGVTSLPMVTAVFSLGLVFYVLFLVGYRTRTFQTLSLLFFLSALSRVTLIREGSVMVMATMLLWSVFLPMGKRFSLDALIEALRGRASDVPGSPEPVESERSKPTLAAFAIVAQIGLIYFFTAAAKHGVTWREGTAMYYALNLDQLARPFGKWLAGQPLVEIKALTWSVLAMEFAVLPLILFPFCQPWPRRVAILTLGSMHVGIALTMHLSFFSATMIATYALLLLPQDWEQLKRSPGLRRLWQAQQALVSRLQDRLLEWSWFVPQIANTPSKSVKLTAQQQGLIALRKRAQQWVSCGIVAVILVTFTVDAYNLNMSARLGSERIHEPRWMRAIILVPLIQQDWELFAPDPTKDDGWWVIVGETESGDQIDPLTGKTPTFDKPADLSQRFDRFWRKYLDRIWLKKNYEYRLYFGKYITRKNHREAPEGHRLARFYFYYVKEVTQPPGTPLPWPTERLLVWHHECFSSAPSAKSETQ